jgi:hypothetical protein
MSKFGHDWRCEKSISTIKFVCLVLEHAKSITSDSDKSFDLRGLLQGALHDASKLMCEAAEDRHGDSNRWSPDLVDYLFKHPEKCDETIKIVCSEHYRDGYFDDYKL